MNPADMLFTTPTLNDSIPATMQGSTVSADCIQLHEDDWRQFEFVPRSLKREVAAELVDISLIWDKHHVSIGDGGAAFNAIHIRKRIPNAMAVPMSLADFGSFVGQKAKPLTFVGYNEVLHGVHAIAIDKLIVYAEIQADTVTALGINPIEQFTIAPEFAGYLTDLIRTHDLMLVHWRSRTLFESIEDVLRYFGIDS